MSTMVMAVGIVVVAADPVAMELGARVVGEVHVAPAVAGGHRAATRPASAPRPPRRPRRDRRARSPRSPRPSGRIGAATDLADRVVQKHQLGGGGTHVHAAVERRHEGPDHFRTRLLLELLHQRLELGPRLLLGVQSEIVEVTVDDHMGCPSSSRSRSGRP